MKKINIAISQPDPPDGPVFGRVMDPVDFMTSQDFAHDHIQCITKDLLVAGAAVAQVAGFAATLTSGLSVRIAKGDVVDENGVQYETDQPDDGSSLATMAAAHVSLPRIDLIVATLAIDTPVNSQFEPFRRLRTQAEQEAKLDPYPETQFEVPTSLHTRAVISVKTGTPNASPAAPVAGAGEVPLWQVHVASGQTNLGGGDLTDVRPLMRSLFQALGDIATIQAQLGSNLIETVQDIVGAFLSSPNSSLTLSYDDAGNVETIVLAAGYKTLLDGATDANTAGALVKRDVNGDFAAGGLVLVRHSQLGEAASNSLLLDIKKTDSSTTPLLSVRKANANGPTGCAIAGEFVGNCNAIDGSLPGVLSVVDGNLAGFSSTGNLLTLLGTFFGVQRIAFKCSSLGDGVFANNLAVTGTLSKGAGTFHIDHPVDPDNKDLIHGFIEAPRYDLIYRGTARLENGLAVVSIDKESGMSPGTFAALTQNAQGDAWNASKDEENFDLVRLIKIEDGHAFLKSNNPVSSVEAGWVVYAERNDPFIKAIGGTDDNGHLKVEIDKPVGDASLLDPLTEVREADEAAPTVEVQRVVDTLVGTKGYPRHAHTVGHGAVPQRTITIETRARKADP